MLRIALLTGSLGLLLALPQTSAAQRRDRDDDQTSRLDTTFAMSRNGTVEINTSGDLTVTGWDRAEIRVIAWSEGGAIRAWSSASGVEIGRGDFSRRIDDARIELTIPRGARLKVSGGSGDVEVRETKGDVEINRMTSDMKLTSVSGVSVQALAGDLHITGADHVSVNLVSGDLIASGIENDVEVNMVSGDLELSDIKSKFVRVTASGGDITYAGALDPQGRYEFTSHAGDVTLLVPANTAGSFSIESYSGDIESDFPITLAGGSSMGGMTRKLDFNLAGGGARISLRSFSGEIHLVRTIPDNRKEN
jgi:hypothetical protein